MEKEFELPLIYNENHSLMLLTERNPDVGEWYFKESKWSSDKIFTIEAYLPLSPFFSLDNNEIGHCTLLPPLSDLSKIPTSFITKMQKKDLGNGKKEIIGSYKLVCLNNLKL